MLFINFFSFTLTFTFTSSGPKGAFAPKKTKRVYSGWVGVEIIRIKANNSVQLDLDC